MFCVMRFPKAFQLLHPMEGSEPTRSSRDETAVCTAGGPHCSASPTTGIRRIPQPRRSTPERSATWQALADGAHGPRYLKCKTGYYRVERAVGVAPVGDFRGWRRRRSIQKFGCMQFVKEGARLELGCRCGGRLSAAWRQSRRIVSVVTAVPERRKTEHAGQITELSGNCRSVRSALAALLRRYCGPTTFTPADCVAVVIATLYGVLVLCVQCSAAAYDAMVAGIGWGEKVAFREYGGGRSAA